MSSPANPTCNLVRPLLPDCVVVVEGPIAGEPDGLWPEEIAFVEKAVEKRRKEFACGRDFARRCFGVLGLPRGPIPANPDRSPRWPDGLVGSITHTDAYCAVAVARRTKVHALGIDVEAVSRFRPELLPYVLSQQEMARNLQGLGPQARQRVAAVLFSAKEAFYKCVQTTIRLRDSAIELDQGSETFQVRLPPSNFPSGTGEIFTGRYACDGERVATAMVLPLQVRAFVRDLISRAELAAD
jgi:4'-phosphopantetheinyl transferase EntD